MDKYIYLVTPFLAWISAGVLKALINAIKLRRLASNKIGLGGFPSNHTTIATSMVWLIGFREGISSPVFGLGLTFAVIVMLDALDLRRHIGSHAKAINLIGSLQGANALRQSIGHKPIEVIAGIVLGGIIAATVHYGSSMVMILN